VNEHYLLILFACWRILQKIPGSESRCGWLTKFNQFFLVHNYTVTCT